MDDDNIFDEDDALDYVMYEEAEKDSKQPVNQSGCLGLLLLTIFPSVLIIYNFVV